MLCNYFCKSSEIKAILIIIIIMIHDEKPPHVSWNIIMLHGGPLGGFIRGTDATPIASQYPYLY